MPLFVNNDNDVQISNVFFEADPDTPIVDGDFKMSLCEEDTILITDVTDSTVTTQSAHGLEVGDKVLINRVVGAVSANGIYTILSVPTTTTFTAGFDASAETYEDSRVTGQVWKIIAEEIELTWNSVTEAFTGTLQGSLQLIPNRKYMLFIKEANYEAEWEISLVAKIRTS